MKNVLRKIKRKLIPPVVVTAPVPHVPLKLGVLDLPSEWMYHTFCRNLTASQPEQTLIDLAQLLHNTGQHDLALSYYRAYLEIYPSRELHSLYLQCLLHSENSTNQSLQEAHAQWVRLYADAEPTIKLTNNPDPHKKLRVGYLCHFFGNSISKYCLLPVLDAHDPEKFAVYCYDDGETALQDRNPQFIWRDIRGKSDLEVAEIIRNDQIDVLQEANGHCLINRFGVLALRAAPVQINWYNHTATTGMKSVDYAIADEISIPPEDDAFYTEKVYRNDGFIGAIDLVQHQTKPASLPPVVKNKYITFGYFGGGHKITEQAIALWSSILHAVPSAKLLLKGAAMDNDLSRTAFLKIFEKNGIKAQRLILCGHSSQQETLAMYDSIDIMLDVVSHTGGTTMFEALWQGVPVLSLRGKRWSARSGASVLDRLGCPELIAENFQDFIEKAMVLANDITRLKMYRVSLRDKMQQSSLIDMQLFSRNLEKAYRYMWQQWCEKQK